MESLEIVRYPDPVLRQPAKPVERFDQELIELVARMKHTMVHSDGVGLAAPQVGISLRVLVLSEDGTPEKARALINPKVSLSGPKGRENEGCLSFPGIYAEIERPDRIRIEAVDEQGQPQVFEADGWVARIVQHEYDHLEGRLFIDRMSSADRVRIKRDLERLREEWQDERG
ncbi:MAG: peptide deformylase [Planctomycetes bacterium]|nr:peptide deformylase [Planctomycetota bacterium]